MNNTKNIVFTGGHAGSTAYAVLEKFIIDKRSAGYNIFFVGAGSAVEGRKIKTFEELYLPKLGVKYVNLDTGRLQRKFSFWTIPSIIKLPLGFIKAFSILRKINPVLTVSFGGFVALPVVFSSWILRVPIIIHEQTSGKGLANQLSISFADKILLSRKESVKQYPSHKSEIIGNPIWEAYSKISLKNKPSKKSLIFITGGSRGSKSINLVVFKLLDKLLQKYKIFHQTGEADFKLATRYKQSLNRELSKNYHIYSTIEPEKFVQMIDFSDLVIARSGANTVSGIIAAKRLSILIPLPFSQNNEQFENAKYVESFRSGKIINQNDLNEETLYDSIEKMISDYQNLVGRFKEPDFDDKKASQLFVEQIFKIMHEKGKTQR
ncbi:MAG TPA: glycosyltransferase [Patescibacteria group bacterium]|nr:glycosyltransferase [Patescibacteria group bacterium]